MSHWTLKELGRKNAEGAILHTITKDSVQFLVTPMTFDDGLRRVRAWMEEGDTYQEVYTSGRDCPAMSRQEFLDYIEIDLDEQKEG